MCHHGIEKVFQLAVTTFSKKCPADSFRRNLETLMAAASRLTGEDVGLEQCQALHRAGQSPSNTLDSPGGGGDRRESVKQPAPVTYIPVTETHDISIGIFVIREGESIPLHDHPSMHGVIKCLAGNLRITSYTRKEAHLTSVLPDRIKNSGQMREKLRFGELFLAERVEPSLEVSPDHPCCVLEPDQANIHQIESVGGPAAFLDILAPPYNIDPPPEGDDTQERDCHYFRVLPDSASSPALRWLLQSQPPASFFCDTEAYRGPALH